MIFVAYRDNDLFRTYLPKVLEGLPIVGTFVIPEGTRLEDRKDDFVAAIDAAVANGATKFLTDETCGLYKYGKFKNCRQINGTDFWDLDISLDRIFGREVRKWMGHNSVEQNLAWFAEQIASGRTVEKIVIVADRLGDHPFMGEREWRYSFGEELIPSLVEDVRKVVAEKYPAAAIEIADDFESAMKFADEENTMLLLDRHCGIKVVMNQDYENLSMWPNKAMLYVLPFETTAAQLISRGTFPYSFSIDQMRADIQAASAKIR